MRTSWTVRIAVVCLAISIASTPTRGQDAGARTKPITPAGENLHDGSKPIFIGPLRKAGAGGESPSYPDLLGAMAIDPFVMRTVLVPDTPRVRTGSVSETLRSVVGDQNGDTSRAMLRFTKALAQDPTDASALLGRALARLRHGENDSAIDDFSALIKLDPNNAEAYLSRASAWSAKAVAERAIADYTEFLRIDEARISALKAHAKADPSVASWAPALERTMRKKESGALVHRGQLYRALGDFARARADFDRAVECGPDVHQAHWAQAWFLATCPEPRYRDGRAAVAAARHARGPFDFYSFATLATLAAAHAEAGDFPAAVRLQREAVQCASDDEKTAAVTLLFCFLTGNPIREPATFDVLNQRGQIRWFLTLGFDSWEGVYVEIATNIAPAIHIYPRRWGPPTIRWTVPLKAWHH